MRFCVAIICLLSFSMLLIGCNGARETDEVAWVLSLGADRADDGELLLTYRIGIPQSTSSGGEPGSASGAGKKTSDIIVIKAPTLAEGQNLLNASLSRTLSLNHVTAIIIGEKLAREGVQDLISQCLRFRNEFRGTIFLVVARGNVQEIMQENKPPIETLVSRWVENYMRTHNDTSYYLPINLHEFYQRLKLSSGAPLAIGYAANPLTGEDKNSSAAPEWEGRNYFAGDMPRQGGNQAEFVGTAVFKEDRLAGYLGTKETRALAILSNQLTHSLLSVSDPLAPQFPVSIAVRNGRDSRIKVDINGEAPTIDIDIFLEAEIINIPSGIAYESSQYKPLLEEKVSKAIQADITGMLNRTQSWGTDVADFGYYIRPKFTTYEEMKAFGWNRRYLQAVFDVKVKTEIRRTGLMRLSEEIRRE